MRQFSIVTSDKACPTVQEVIHNLLPEFFVEGKTPEPMKPGIFLLLSIILCGCVAGGLRPTIATYPAGYVERFPLNTVTEAELLAKIGPPNQKMKIDGKQAFVYRMGEDYGVRSYTYIFENGVVSDVIYNDNGPMNGISASQKQSSKQ